MAAIETKFRIAPGLLDDWYVLEGGRNWADVEGTADEWRAIAVAIRARKRESFKRAAVAGAGPGKLVTLWSPRNACGANDHVELTAEEADALAAQIDQLLSEVGPDGGV